MPSAPKAAAVPTGPPARPAFDADDTPAGRILRTTREMLFTTGYNALTMDALAHELGMSKKTLYQHFDGKEAIVDAVIDTIERTIQRQTAAAIEDERAGFTTRLRNVILVIGSQYGTAAPVLLRDLQRFAPALYRKIDELRNRNIPLVIGRLLRSGITEGKVRPDIDPDFAVQFFLHAMNGMLNPATIERLGSSPRAVFEQGIALFFWAVLTEAGRQELTQIPRT